MRFPALEFDAAPSWKRSENKLAITAVRALMDSCPFKIQTDNGAKSRDGYADDPALPRGGLYSRTVLLGYSYYLAVTARSIALPVVLLVASGISESLGNGRR